MRMDRSLTLCPALFLSVTRSRECLPRGIAVPLEHPGQPQTQHVVTVGVLWGSVIRTRLGILASRAWGRKGFPDGETGALRGPEASFLPSCQSLFSHSSVVSLMSADIQDASVVVGRGEGGVCCV